MMSLQLFLYLILLMICSAIAISSLILKSGTNAAVTLGKMKEKEGFLGLVLVLASVYYFVESIQMLRVFGGFGIVQAIFLMILSLVGVGLGFLLGFTLLMKAGTTLPDAPGFPVVTDASSAGGPPPIPPAPAAAPAANAAAALNMVRVPLCFAGLGLGLIVYIFSFFTPTHAAIAAYLR